MTVYISGLVGNILTLAVLIRSPRLKNCCTPYLISLTICDLLVSTLILPMIGLSGLSGSVLYPEEVCKVFSFLLHLFLCKYLVKITFLKESQYSLHILIRAKDQFCNHSSSLESFHTLRIFVWKFNFHQAIQRVLGKNAWWKLNFHTKILRVWKDSKLQEWLKNWSFSLINMWSEY